MTCAHGTTTGPCAHCQEIAHEVKLAIAEMRERCAKVAEEFFDARPGIEGGDGLSEDLAAAIRALKDEP